MNYSKLIQHFKTQQNLADALGISQPSVSEWKVVGIPLVRQYQIQVITDGLFKAERKSNDR